MTLAGTASLPLKPRLGVSYLGTSGFPFTYIATGDPNADGLGQFGARNNDVVYLPRDSSDITLADPADYARLEQAIQSQACLPAQRGRLMQRNSCRGGWMGRLDMRISKLVPTTLGQALELTADLFNALNFVDRDWGRTYLTGDVSGGRVPLLNLVGNDAANDRGVYEVEDIPQHEVDLPGTRWRVQLSAKYTF